MLKVFRFTILVVFVFLAGCSNIASYEDNEVAAIVKGETITIGELRFLYPDDTALDYLNGAIKAELAKQEVEEMDLDISDNLSNDKDGGWFAELPPADTKDEGGKQIRKFAESQAKKLNMEPEAYQREYAKRIEEQNAYIVTYLEEKLEITDFENEKEMEVFNEKADVLLEELAEENKDDIEVFVE